MLSWKSHKIIVKMEELKIESVDNSTVIASDEESEVSLSEEKGRRLRKRSSSDILHGTSNKGIKKKKSSNPGEFKSEKDAKKFYLNINKKIKLKPAILETIFEEQEEEETEDDETTVQAKQLGKASKRTLTIKDGYNISKALTNKRKNQIKRKLGSRKKPKKVALKKFMEDFKKTQQANECDSGEQ